MFNMSRSKAGAGAVLGPDGDGLDGPGAETQKEPWEAEASSVIFIRIPDVCSSPYRASVQIQ
jgi:hypothetical protein